MSRFRDFGKAWIRILPTIEESLVLQSRRRLVSHLIEQSCDLEDVSRLVRRHPFLVCAVGQQVTIDCNRAAHVTPRLRNSRWTVTKQEIVHQNGIPARVEAQPPPPRFGKRRRRLP